MMQLVWLVALWLPSVVVAQTCPPQIEQCNYAASRQDTNDAVINTLVSVFSGIVGTPVEEEDERQLYETVSTGLGINATSEGFVRFQEAVNEIAVASLQECSRPESERVSLDDVTNLAATFHQLLNNSNVTQAREIYGKLVCLQSLSQQPEIGSRKKRQSTETENLKELEEFFENLEGEILATIFGLQYIIIEEEQVISISRPTLAFVVDDTGSMAEEIESVQRLIRSFVRTERTNPISYILATFNDPEVGVPMKYSSTNLTELMALEAAVEALIADGGGDCAELGMTGTLNALGLSNPESNVIILTDAEPKDSNLTRMVIDTAKQLRNSVHLFLSDPSCGDTDPYIEVANETNGIIVYSIVDFEAFADFADAALTFQFDSTSGGAKRQVDENCLRFVVSAFTEEVRIFFMARNHTLNITDPDGNVTSLHINGSIGVYYNEQPQLGHYQVCSDRGGFEYALSAPTVLDMFVEYLDNESSSTQPPPAGTNTTVLITTSRLGSISMDHIISLNLIDMESGEEASSVPLMLCSGFLTGDIMVPNSTFQYQLRGTDAAGNMFEHLSNRLVTPTSPDERIITPLNCPVPQPTPTPSSTPNPSSTPTIRLPGGAATCLTPVATMCYTVAIVVLFVVVM